MSFFIASQCKIFCISLLSALAKYYSEHNTLEFPSRIPAASPPNAPQFQAPHIELNPPSTGSPIPVTHAASSLARNTAALAISWGVPNPPNGCRCSTIFFCSAASGVSNPEMKAVAVNPGQRALTWTRYGAQSCAAAFVRPRTACLDVT